MKQSFRLKHRQDIKRVLQDGQSFVHEAIVLRKKSNECDQNRVAVIAGRSLGGAVQRNYAKRRLRSAYYNLMTDLQPGNDFIFIARKPILSIDYEEIVFTMRRLFKQAGVMKENER